MRESRRCSVDIEFQYGIPDLYGGHAARRPIQTIDVDDQVADVKGPDFLANFCREAEEWGPCGVQGCFIDCECCEFHRDMIRSAMFLIVLTHSCNVLLHWC